MAGAVHHRWEVPSKQLCGNGTKSCSINNFRGVRYLGVDHWCAVEFPSSPSSSKCLPHQDSVYVLRRIRKIVKSNC